MIVFFFLAISKIPTLLPFDVRRCAADICVRIIFIRFGIDRHSLRSVFFLSLTATSFVFQNISMDFRGEKTFMKFLKNILRRQKRQIDQYCNFVVAKRLPFCFAILNETLFERDKIGKYIVPVERIYTFEVPAGSQSQSSHIINKFYPII